MIDQRARNFSCTMIRGAAVITTGRPELLSGEPNGH